MSGIREQGLPDLPGDWREGLARLEPSEAQYEAAAQWLGELRERDETSSIAFERWRAEHPAHAFAYAEVESLFHMSARPARRTARFQRIGMARVRQRGRWPLVAGIVAVAAALLLALPYIPTPLYWGADAVTGAGVMRTVRLADGTRVMMNTRSALNADIGKTERHVSLLGGEAYFEVAKDKARPFTIVAGDARIRVVGTKFNVHMNDGQVGVFVTEGVVRVTSRAQTIQLRAGQGALVEHGAVQALPETPFSEGLWRRKKIVFWQAPLRLVKRELNRYRAAPIYILNDSLGDNTVTGVFSTDDPDGAVKIIQRTLGAESVTLPTGQTFLY
jgi:transmembrane sensor